jgi:hypothetical protein
MDPAADSIRLNTLKLQQNKIFLKDFENVHTSCILTFITVCPTKLTSPLKFKPQNINSGNRSDEN